MRLDKYLKVSRLIKRRTVANEACDGGRITVKLWAGEYKAFVEILDQGRGIPPEDLENVKTKFYKGSNAVRGSGIGLALVDSIMTALDGTMDIQSTLGRGTVVTLGLPLYHKA